MPWAELESPAAAAAAAAAGVCWWCCASLLIVDADVVMVEEEEEEEKEDFVSSAGLGFNILRAKLSSSRAPVNSLASSDDFLLFVAVVVVDAYDPDSDDFE